MATTRLTFGAVLGTIQNTANTVNSTLDTVNTAVGMAHHFVKEAADKQQKRSIIDMATFEKNMIREKELEQAELDEKIVSICKQNSVIQAAFDSYSKEFEALLKS